MSETSYPEPISGPQGAGTRRVSFLAAAALATVTCIGGAVAQSANASPPRVPDKLVVLTFDDSAVSHAKTVAPLLKKYGFGATFFITEGFDFTTNKKHYMTWAQIKALHEAGFEIGNHTRHHKHVRGQSPKQLVADIAHIEKQCARHGIPKPTSFCYPAYVTSKAAVEVLRARGYRFARAGGARAFDPATDEPLLAPQAFDGKPRSTFEQFVAATAKAKDGKVAVMTFHGVPDVAHPWVSSTPARFERYLKHLADEGCKVIALRDLEKYVPAKDAKDAKRTAPKPKKAAKPQAGQWNPAKTYAVIVGVLEWRADLTPYSKRHRKDQELRDLLIKRGTPAANINMLLDRQATLPKIRAAVLDTVRRAPSDATLIVYYAGHGWKHDGDFCFANYEVQPKKKETAWNLTHLGSTLAREFKGNRAFFWADCCYSGGLNGVVDELAARKVAAFSLTSASTANTSTSNWTFTQSIIDGLSGEPLVDRDGDGLITLGELRTEVREAMQHMEGQEHGFQAGGLADGFVLARTRAPRASRTQEKNAKTAFPLGSYVVASGNYGRIVGAAGADYTVQFYRYSDKVVKTFAAKDLKASKRKPNIAAQRDAGMKPDCKVEWRGDWYNAKVLKTKDDRWYIHYVGDDDSWNEWVGKARIRFLKKKPGAAK